MRKNEKETISTKIGCIVMCIYLCIVFLHQCPATSPSPQEQKENDIAALNDSCYEECFPDIIIAIALLEGYRSNPYFCGAKWTIGYGSTVLPNGLPVTEHTPSTNTEDAKRVVYKHLNKRVKPFLKYVYRPLNSSEMICTCLFIYNIGGKNFSGYDESGNQYGQPSNFLCAINQNLPAEECVRRLTGFRSSNGKQANGLLKRRWVEGAIYLGLLTTDDILTLKPEGFYNDTVSFYYLNTTENTDGYWEYDYSPTTIKNFLKKNIASETNNVLSIL